MPLFAHLPNFSSFFGLRGTSPKDYEQLAEGREETAFDLMAQDLAKCDGTGVIRARRGNTTELYKSQSSAHRKFFTLRQFTYILRVTVFDEDGEKRRVTIKDRALMKDKWGSSGARTLLAKSYTAEDNIAIIEKFKQKTGKDLSANIDRMTEHDLYLLWQVKNDHFQDVIECEGSTRAQPPGAAVSQPKGGGKGGSPSPLPGKAQVTAPNVAVQELKRSQRTAALHPSGRDDDDMGLDSLLDKADRITEEMAETYAEKDGFHGDGGKELTAVIKSGFEAAECSLNGASISKEDRDAAKGALENVLLAIEKSERDFKVPRSDHTGKRGKGTQHRYEQLARYRGNIKYILTEVMSLLGNGSNKKGTKGRAVKTDHYAAQNLLFHSEFQAEREKMRSQWKLFKDIKYEALLSVEIKNNTELRKLLSSIEDDIKPRMLLIDEIEADQSKLLYSRRLEREAASIYRQIVKLKSLASNYSDDNKESVEDMAAALRECLNRAKSAAKAAPSLKVQKRHDII